MRAKDLKWSKTRAQCPYCDNWYSRQGILGHIRFRHPDRNKKDDMLETPAQLALMRALRMMRENGRLTPETREILLDLMLLDYLQKMAKT